MRLTPLESNLHKYDPVVTSQIMKMIEVDTFWHLKTFEAVLNNLQRRWDEEIEKQKDMSMHCTENSKTNDEMEGIEVINPCSENQTKNCEFHKGKKAQSKKVGTK